MGSLKKKTQTVGSLKKTTQTVSKSYLPTIPVETLLNDRKMMTNIRHLFPTWWYTTVLNDIVENDMSVSTPGWFIEYLLSTNIGYDKKFREKRLDVLYDFFLSQEAPRDFQMVGLLKNIQPECYYNDDCYYDNRDILFAVQYNESLILFLLYTPECKKIKDYIWENTSRVFDRDFNVKVFSKWFEKRQLRLVGMFLVEQFYFGKDAI